MHCWASHQWHPSQPLVVLPTRPLDFGHGSDRQNCPSCGARRPRFVVRLVGGVYARGIGVAGCGRDFFYSLRRATLMRRDSICGLAVLVFALVAVEGRATNKDWNDGSDVWSNALDWTPNGVPGAGDTVNISFADDVARTVTYDYTGPAVTLGYVSMDMTGAGTNANTLSMSANTLKSEDVIV